MLFVTFIFGLLIVIAVAIFIRMGFYIYGILIYKGHSNRTQASTPCVPKPESSAHDGPVDIHNRRISIHPDPIPTSVIVVRDTPRRHQNSETGDSIVSQVVARDGKLVVLNYSMTNEFTLVKKVSRKPSAPPLEVLDDEPPSYDACTRNS